MATPLLLDLADAHVVCVGGGPVARGKVLPLIEDGALVTVIAPEVDAVLATAARQVLTRGYVVGDLGRIGAGPPGADDDGLLALGPVSLVVAATGVPDVDTQVAAEARAAGVWCIAAAGAGTAAVPGVVRRDGLLIAFATGAPALTKRLRQRLDALLGVRWGAAATVLAELRADPEIRGALAALEPGERRMRWHAAVDVALGEGPDASQVVPPSGGASRANMQRTTVAAIRAVLLG